MAGLEIFLTLTILYLLSLSLSYTGAWGWVIDEGREDMTLPEKIVTYFPVLNSFMAICIICDWIQIWTAQKLFPEERREDDVYS